MCLIWSQSALKFITHVLVVVTMKIYLDLYDDPIKDVRYYMTTSAANRLQLLLPFNMFKDWKLESTRTSKSLLTVYVCK